MGSPVWRKRRANSEFGHRWPASSFHLLRCAAREGRNAQEAKARERRGIWPYGRGLRAPWRFVRKYVLSYGKAHVSRHQRGLRAKRNRRDNGR